MNDVKRPNQVNLYVDVVSNSSFSHTQSCDYAELSQTDMRTLDGVRIIAYTAYDALLAATQLCHLRCRYVDYAVIHRRSSHQNLSSRTVTGMRMCCA